MPNEALLASLTWIPLPTDLCCCKIRMADGNRAMEEADRYFSSAAGVFHHCAQLSHY